MRDALIVELGTRVLLHCEALPRDLRWFRGLYGYCAIHRKAMPCPRK